MEPGAESSSTVLEQRRALWESGQLQREFIGQMLSPPVIIEIGSAIKQVSAAVSKILKPEVVESLKSVASQVRTVISSPEALQTMRTALAIGKEVERILNSPLVAYLLSDNAPELERIVEGSGTAALSVQATADLRVISNEQIELEQQIVNHLESGDEVSALSEPQKQHLKTMLTILLLICAYLAAQNGVREELCFLQPKLFSTMTSNQVGKSVRAALCDSPVDQLNSYRSVRGVGVRLRAGPKMNAAVIQVALQDRALLEILDSSNRDWLHVAVVGEEGVEGWISRKYTHPINR